MDEDQLFLRPERPEPKLPSGEAEFIMAQLARMPTRWRLVQTSPRRSLKTSGNERDAFADLDAFRAGILKFR
jgi:hypothetical protein